MPGADRRHVGLDELHRVVDREPGGHRTARAVDVHIDVFIGIFALQEEELRDDEGGHPVVDRSVDEDDAFFEEPRVDVVRALSARALLDDHRYQMSHVRPP